MFKRLQFKMTLYYTLILISILVVTNISIYYVMVRYNNYQMATEVKQMLENIKDSEWLYENYEEISSKTEHSSDEDSIQNLPQVKDLIIPQTLHVFPTYMIFDTNHNLIKWEYDRKDIFDKLLVQSDFVNVSETPKMVTITNDITLHYLMAKMPISISGQNLGYYVVVKDVTVAYETLDNLLNILIISLIAGIILSVVLGYLIAGRSLKPVKDAYASKQEFLANASHELKTPLSVILLSTETLDGEIDKANAFQHQIVDDIKDEANKMNNLVSQLLYLSRNDSQKIASTYEHFNFTDLVEREMNSFEKIAFSKGIIINSTISPGVKFYGDKKQLGSVVAILIDNAIKYSKSGDHVQVSLEKSETNNKQLTKFIVKDTGIGIPESELQRIFERFYRLETSRSKDTGGYGLGLAIAKEIIEQHDGKIEVISAENDGTTFTVLFNK